MPDSCSGHTENNFGPLQAGDAKTTKMAHCPTSKKQLAHLLA